MDKFVSSGEVLEEFSDFMMRKGIRKYIEEGGNASNVLEYLSSSIRLKNTTNSENAAKMIESCIVKIGTIKED